jgi:membrane-associated phospholipid phosphatase
VSPRFNSARFLFLLFLACAAVGTVSFLRFDVAVARHVYPYMRHLANATAGLGGILIVSAEAVVLLVLFAIRRICGPLSFFGKALMLACLSSICAYAFNSLVLKVCFGVPTPSQVLEGTAHAFNFLAGTPGSSFPSGHMALAGAFAGVFMQSYRKCFWPFAALLTIAAGLLVLGDWHFVSDVAAGTFLGISTGMLAGEFWLSREK